MSETSLDELDRHLIAALDLDTLDQALNLVDALQGQVSKFKIGSRMFTRYGPAVLDALAERGVEVFLDLKFHDIPSVVADAVRNGATHEAVFMMTVHASGGSAMLEQAAQAAAEADRPPKIVAVTALTSLSADDVHTIGITGSLAEWARRLGQLSVDAGVDGLVCSAHEASALRRAFGDEPLLVTPGIRPHAQLADGDDQTRVMTPAQALAAGSDYLVVGRPIYQADDPSLAVQAMKKPRLSRH